MEKSEEDKRREKLWRDAKSRGGEDFDEFEDTDVLKKKKFKKGKPPKPVEFEDDNEDEFAEYEDE